jgi:hypothetical protein
MYPGEVVSKTYNRKPVQKRRLKPKGFLLRLQTSVRNGDHRPTLKMKAPVPWGRQPGRKSKAFHV